MSTEYVHLAKTKSFHWIIQHKCNRQGSRLCYRITIQDTKIVNYLFQDVWKQDKNFNCENNKKILVGLLSFVCHIPVKSAGMILVWDILWRWRLRRYITWWSVWELLSWYTLKIVKSLQLILRLAIHRWNLWVPYLRVAATETRR